MSKGLSFFWPTELTKFQLTNNRIIIGEIDNREKIPSSISNQKTSKPNESEFRIKVKVGNRDLYGQDFRWINESEIVTRSQPENLVCIERLEFGNMYGQSDIAQLGNSVIQVTVADGRQLEIQSAEIVRVFAPNSLNLFNKIGIYLSRLIEFVSGQPREANMEGGIFPAIFGTVMMVLIMSVVAVPLGVLVAIYLHEYAQDSFLIRVIRIAMNNLAGVPSIVFGMFGLGFFIYFIGGGIDNLFFKESLPSPTFGTSGILWASLTLSLLTLPVVVVSTEEALAAVPQANREGALALASTKLQMLWYVVLPNALPGILTGMILAISRGAGEVAPLMITGAVKLAPDLPIDTTFPFVHLNRKFMHLGFHIYDVGFQSPNVEAAKPMVFMTALLLVSLVFLLNLVAITLRNRIRARYSHSGL